MSPSQPPPVWIVVIRGGDPHGGTAVEQGLEHTDGPAGLDSADAVGEFFYVGGVVFGEQPISQHRQCVSTTE